MRSASLVVLALLLGTSNLAQAQESELSLELASAKISDDRRSFTASLLRNMQLETGLSITLLARDNSDSTIIDLTLWESACSLQDVGGEVVSVCGKSHRVKLEDGFGNDLNGGATKPNVVLYPGEQSVIEIYGRRPVPTDGSFTLTINGVSVSGHASR